ncbi:MAG: GMC family oxidoreductase [Aquimonas sp.]|nr:GMC family oxidoreductase [Aquimonas sp.]
MIKPMQHAETNPMFDAIIVGSGMTGGWAAKELTERGLKVLVLERGPAIDPATDYSDMVDPWDHPNLNAVSQDEIEGVYPYYPSVSYAMFNSNKKFWASDANHPYEATGDRSFVWIRGYHVGGRSLMWGRASYRWGASDFESNKRDGYGVDWPIRYGDLAPWYDKVERFVGVAGDRDGLENLPDGQFLPGFAMNSGERLIKAKVEAAFPTRNVVIGRVANLSQPTAEHSALGRGQCQSRSLCSRGCSFSAYFSSLTATLPAAEVTGLMTLKTNAIVHSILTDPQTGRATGVRVIDAETKAGTIYTGRMVFLCASAIGSAAVLLNSASEANPNGLANRSDQVGRNLMDHIIGGNVQGRLPGMLDMYYKGRRPIPSYMPRYGNFSEAGKPYLRGFGFQISAGRGGWDAQAEGIGEELKSRNRMPGGWSAGFLPFAEMLPRPENRVTLHPSRKDKWGIPVPVIRCEAGDNERLLIAEATKDAREMLAVLDCTDITPADDAIAGIRRPGEGIHEMGTARMGRDPTTSVLNGWAQAHDVPNLFVTDGAAMASSATQNPSLTYMTITARAANHAADLLQGGKI